MKVCSHCKKSVSELDGNFFLNRGYTYFRCRKCESEKRKKYLKTDKGKQIMRDAVKRHREKNKHQHNAGNMIYRAVKWGKLVKPIYCGLCGNKAKLHGHHFDYQKPLLVIWLCPLCHSRTEKRLRKQKRG